MQRNFISPAQKVDLNEGNLVEIGTENKLEKNFRGSFVAVKTKF